MKLLLMLIAAMLVFATPTYADTTCQPIYGGGQTCVTTGVSIEKDVVNPVTNNDVHDLGTGDPNFRPGDTVTFHITVHNTGSVMMNNATVVDTFPANLNFVSGPGNFNTNARTLTFTVGSLSPNQSQTFTVTGSVAQSTQFGTTPVCLVNQVLVTTSDNQTAQDSSQFCISAVIQPTPSVAAPQVISTPATGSNPLVILLFISSGVSGYVLLRKKGGTCVR